MKKALALLCALVLLLHALPAVADFNLNYFTENSSIFTIDVNKEKSVAFIETVMSAQELAFEHKYESPTQYSLLRNDILVLDYFSTNRSPVFRTWIYYCTTKPIYVHSVTFELDGTAYTFTDVASSDRVITNEQDTEEDLLIRYGGNNSDFLAKVMAEAASYAFSHYGDDGDPNVQPPKMKMILHGIEDIELDVPDGFWTDFALLTVALVTTESLGQIGKNTGTPCTIRQLDGAAD